MQQHHQGVRLRVEEAPDSMGEGLSQRELLGGREGVAVDTESLGPGLGEDQPPGPLGRRQQQSQDLGMVQVG